MKEESMMSARDRLVAAALTLCALAAAVAAMAAPAGAATYGNGYQLSKFKVEIKGWKTTVQQNHHLAADDCDVDNFSSGSEKVWFRSPKPIVVIASHFPGGDNPEFFSGKRLAIPTKATVERSYTPRISRSGPACEENGGGVENVTKPDCGKKVVNPYPLRLEYFSPAAPNKLTLMTETTDDPYESCPGAAHVGFPYLNVLDDESRWIGAELSQQELFDPKFRKWISIAHGSRKVREGEWWAKTTIHWEVSFTRLKEKVTSR